MGLPTTWARDIFVSFHGSFDRNPPTGYGVVQWANSWETWGNNWKLWSSSVPFPLNRTKSESALGYTFLIQATNMTSCPGKCIRPVGLAFGSDNCLYVSSDTTGEVCQDNLICFPLCWADGFELWSFLSSNLKLLSTSESISPGSFGWDILYTKGQPYEPCLQFYLNPQIDKPFELEGSIKTGGISRRMFNKSCRIWILLP